MFIKILRIIFILIILIGCSLTSHYVYVHSEQFRKIMHPGNVKTSTSTPQQKKEEQSRKQAAPPPRQSRKPARAVLPAGKKLTAPFVSQLPQLPNGCEISSLAMLLQSAGVNVGKMELAEQINKVPFESDGFMGNPHQGFVGNMYYGNRNHPGLAVYHEPVAALARKYLGNRLIDLSGKPWQDVERQIAEGHPVWVITSINFQKVPAGKWQPWRTRTGTLQISFMEHSVLVTGYDRQNVFFSNPLLTGPGSYAAKAGFVAAWEQFGNQAVSYISGK